MISAAQYIGFIFLMIILVFCANGCVEEQPGLLSENKVIADSIIRQEIKFIITEVDSLCKLTYEENFNRSVDSISKVRLEEIEKYIPSK